MADDAPIFFDDPFAPEKDWRYIPTPPPENWFDGIAEHQINWSASYGDPFADVVKDEAEIEID